MAEYADRIERTLKAAADLSGGPTHRLVSITGVSQVGSGADGGIAVGVLENKPAAANRAARVTVFGVTKVRAGAAVTAGDEITGQATGYAIKATSGTFIIGQAYTTAASGMLVEADIYKGGYKG